ncbi:unnamed protein product [Ilex paraguariensis]|uniref:Uncharacterized protein n=1 Tax=Ilex paraguariensis TaxID=185542 RepID=A0ABC8RR83_9AQUA
MSRACDPIVDSSAYRSMSSDEGVMQDGAISVDVRAQANLVETGGLIGIGEAVIQAGVEGKMEIHGEAAGAPFGKVTQAVRVDIGATQVARPEGEVTQEIGAGVEALWVMGASGALLGDERRLWSLQMALLDAGHGQVRAPVASPGTRQGQTGVRTTSLGLGRERATLDAILSMLGDIGTTTVVGHRARKPRYGVMEHSMSGDVGVSDGIDSGQMADDMVRSGGTPRS